MKHIYVIMWSAFALLLGIMACENRVHEEEYGLSVALDNSLCVDVPIGKIQICIYGINGELVASSHYADAKTLASIMLPLEAGHYTIAVVINTDAEITETATLIGLHEWLETETHQNEHLLSGMAEFDMATEGITRIVVPIRQGEFTLPMLRLLLTLPKPKLPDYTNTRTSVSGYVLRCVIELCKTGTDKVLLHKSVSPQPQTDGTYLVELAAAKGIYDLHLWTDYAHINTPLDDSYYCTEKLKAVTISTAPYTANTDTKDASYYSHPEITLGNEANKLFIQLHRPLAKYRLLATDVEAYQILEKDHPEKYPPLEGLTVTLQYEGFFPSCFNVATGSPSDAIGGISYSQALVHTANTEMQVASDWVLVDDKGSFVSATLTVTDRKGNIISRTSGVRIDYRQGYLTTLRGKFLTAGIGGGGIQIETEWDGEYVIEF